MRSENTLGYFLVKQPFGLQKQTSTEVELFLLNFHVYLQKLLAQTYSASNSAITQVKTIFSRVTL